MQQRRRVFRFLLSMSSVKRKANTSGNGARKKTVRRHVTIAYENESVEQKPSSTTTVDTATQGPISKWNQTWQALEEMRTKFPAPVDDMGCDVVKKRHPDASDEELKRLSRLRTLVSLMLSSQTKDTENYKAMQRLIDWGLTVDNLLSVDDEKLDEMIRNVGFHNKKVVYLKKAAKMCKELHGGDIPNTYESLKALPGVGPKMAHLAMQSAWGIVLGISVDTHVHRISKRLGWTKNAKTPGDTGDQLELFIPKDKWRRTNHMLVGHGQTICLPRNPKCDECILFHRSLCPRIGEGHAKGLKRNKTM